MDPASTQQVRATTDRRQPTGHQYHATADLLSGQLERPIVQCIPPQAPLSLFDWRGGHLYQRVNGYDLEGLVSFKSGYTRVSGYRSQKKTSFVTVATAVIEGLNVFDILTADRVVAQVSTSHREPYQKDLGHVPHVTFLGTQFTNVKIGGYDVDVTVNPEICGERPKGDVPYLFDEAFLNRAKENDQGIANFSQLPEGMEIQAEGFRQEYKDEIQKIECLQKQVGDPDDLEHKIACPLVKIELPKEIPGVKVVKNVLYIRDFGIVSLGNVEVGRKYEGIDENGRPEMSNYFDIKMFDMRLGCVGEGRIFAASGSGNGKGKP